MKQTQTFRLFQLMKSGSPVKSAEIATFLKVKGDSVPVYIHELKKVFRAEITSIREGRKVVAYQITNVAKMKAVPEFRKNSYGEIPKAKNPLANLADELDAVNAGTHSEKEFADIRSSLGLGDAFSGGGNNGDTY